MDENSSYENYISRRSHTQNAKEELIEYKASSNSISEQIEPFRGQSHSSISPPLLTIKLEPTAYRFLDPLIRNIFLWFFPTTIN